jgi:hypothetical protein
MRTRTRNKYQYKEEDFKNLIKWSPPWRKIYSDLYYRYREGIIEPSQYELFLKLRKMDAPNKPRGTHVLKDNKYPPIKKEKKILTSPIIITFD